MIFANIICQIVANNFRKWLSSNNCWRPTWSSNNAIPSQARSYLTIGHPSSWESAVEVREFSSKVLFVIILKFFSVLSNRENIAYWSRPKTSCIFVTFIIQPLPVKIQSACNSTKRKELSLKIQSMLCVLDHCEVRAAIDEEDYVTILCSGEKWDS